MGKKDWVIHELSSEINRIFGEDGTRKLVEKKIGFWKRVIDSGETGVLDCYVETHDALVEYLEKLNEELPF